VDELFAVEIEPEVRDWPGIPAFAKHFLKVDEYVGLLAEVCRCASASRTAGVLSGDGVGNFVPTLDGAAIRITYWLTPAAPPSC